MLLLNDLKKQYILNHDFVTKKISITVIDRKTQKRRMYTNEKMINKIFAECIHNVNNR